jgi:hypothetical protein
MRPTTLDKGEGAAPNSHLAKINKLIDKVFLEKTSLQLEDYYKCDG